MKDIFADFKNSILRLEEVLRDERSLMVRDSAIQRFEFTIELAWKCLQVFLREQELVCRSPKECLKEGFKMGLVEDDAKWIEMFEDRNLTSHTYDEKTADAVFDRLPGYLAVFKALRDMLENKGQIGE